MLGVYRIYLERPGTFTFQERSYHYFYHWYGLTFLIERAIEVPIIWQKVQLYAGRRILEVGNSLSNFFSFQHDTLDKHDKTDGVINQDVVDFSTTEPYDLIVSISTLEHVGWDETPKDGKKTLIALESMIRCLAPGGELVITFPLGHNTEMDKLFKENKLRFTETYYLQRISHYSNRWIEVGWSDVREAKYGYPFRSGNAVVIGIIKRNKDGTIRPFKDIRNE